MTYTKDIKQITAAIAIFLFVALVTGLLQPSFAGEKDKNNMPVKTNISVRYGVDGDGDKSEAGGAKFVLISRDDKNPMPSGTKGNTKTVDIDGPGKVQFGEMTITRPDAYEYDVIRSGGDSSTYVGRDHSKFHVKLVALNTGEVEQIITYGATGNAKKAEIIFTDTVKKRPDKTTSNSHRIVKTGDNFNPIIAGMIAGIALVIILFLLAGRRRRKYDYR